MTYPSEAPLMFEGFSQALWNRVPDDLIDDRKMAIGALKFCNFYRPVRLKSARLTCAAWKHPQHVTVETFDGDRGWAAVLDIDLPRLEDDGAHDLDLGGLEAQFLRIACDRHHLMVPNMGDQWADTHNVPYGILDGLEFDGGYLADPLAPEDEPLPLGKPLERVAFAPSAPSGMEVKVGGNQARYFGKDYSIGFSLHRPLITHMGWDALGTGKSAINLIRNAITPVYGYPALIPILSGPHWRTLPWTATPMVWGGTLAVEGNVVRYVDVNVGGEVSVDATFTMTADGVRLELTQRVATSRPTLELEAWRFVWNGPASAVATLALPTCEGRTGAASFPLVWSAPGHGGFSCSVVEGDAPVRVQADSYRGAHMTYAGVVLGTESPYGERSFVPGPQTVRATFEMRPEPILPTLAPGVADSDLHAAMHREWGSGLMFRPELAGFSNNAMSTNCHLSQAGVVDLACFTRKPNRGPAPVDLARHTIAMALKAGRGYGDNRDVYLDSDPAILAAAGRVFMASPNRDWLADAWPWICRAADRHLAKCLPNGLVATPITTGNRSAMMTYKGPHDSNVFLPCNAYDTINMGHVDGYSNAETYRAWKSVLGLAVIQGDAGMALKMRDAIAALRENYEKVLWNEETGWLGSWRSRDGELHDYGMLNQLGLAAVYGLVSDDRARDMIHRTEETRYALGLADASYGFPCYLRPIPRYDQMPFINGTAYRFDGADAFGIYCNGTLTLGNAHMYLWALSQFGPKENADRACREILDAHIDLDVVGGEGSGCEFHTHEGLNGGYEGAYVLQFPVLLAIAQHLGWTPRSTPAHWPAEADLPHG